jgi:uncharacterized protein YjbJ (UPF0337 family)
LRLAHLRTLTSGTLERKPKPEFKIDSEEAVIMKPGTQDEIVGKAHEVKGKIKEQVGHVTNNPNLEAEGMGENLAGKVQKKIGQVEKVIEKP